MSTMGPDSSLERIGFSRESTWVKVALAEMTTYSAKVFAVASPILVFAMRKGPFGL